jgi:very-short-patch-repair endonuclease
MGPRVLRSSTAKLTPLVRAQAGLLDVGGDAAIARSSAAALWQLPGFELAPVHVLRARNPGVRSRSLCCLHTSTCFEEGSVAVLDGLRVTTPVRTLLDLAGSVHPARIELLLDRAWAKGLLSWASFHRSLEELGSRGRPGVALLRELARSRPADYRPPESNLEARANQLLVEDGQRPLDRQVDLGGDAWIARVDLVDRECRLVVEVQSDLHHLSLSDQRRDAARRASLELAGWVVIDVREFVLWHRPAEFLDQVRHARRAVVRAAVAA